MSEKPTHLSDIDKEKFKLFLANKPNDPPRTVVVLDYSEDISIGHSVTGWMPPLKQLCSIYQPEGTKYAIEELKSTGWDPFLIKVVPSLQFWANASEDKLVNGVDLGHVSNTDGEDVWFIESWELLKFTLKELQSLRPELKFDQTADLSPDQEIICDFVKWSTFPAMPKQKESSSLQKSFMTLYGWKAY